MTARSPMRPDTSESRAAIPIDKKLYRHFFLVILVLFQIIAITQY